MFPILSVFIQADQFATEFSSYPETAGVRLANEANKLGKKRVSI